MLNVSEVAYPGKTFREKRFTGEEKFFRSSKRARERGERRRPLACQRLARLRRHLIHVSAERTPFGLVVAAAFGGLGCAELLAHGLGDALFVDVHLRQIAKPAVGEKLRRAVAAQV